MDLPVEPLHASQPVPPPTHIVICLDSQLGKITVTCGALGSYTSHGPGEAAADTATLYTYYCRLPIPLLWLPLRLPLLPLLQVVSGEVGVGATGSSRALRVSKG